nr:putative disease resistance protein At1g50180 [Lolium perenne]
MAESAVSAVLGSVGNLAVQETTFLCGVTFEVGLLKDELMRLQAYLKDADSKQRSGDARVAVLVSQIRAAAYEAQNVIEAADYMEKRNGLKNGFMGAISRYARLPSDLVTLHKVGGEIQRVRRKLIEIFQSADRLKIDLYNTAVDGNEFLQDFSQMHQNFEDDVVMVGFENEHEEIVDKLVDNDNMLSAVSIIAMGGAGKTTLAKKVYTTSRVKQHFEVVAWVTVSQTFKGIDLLKDIMTQITGNTYDSVDQMQEYEVGKNISDFLLQKRYLVVLDDVWEVDTWDQLNKVVKAFPDAANGSRVLLTTRKLDVANHVEMPTHVHSLRHLDEEKSWELFRSKALPSYRRSVMCDMDEFEKLGRKLARKCDGLPLALTVLGGYLSRNLNTLSWSDVLLGWPSSKNVDMMRGILARSYKDLPNHHVRSCFVYLAAFPEDFKIKVCVLIELWIAEGFIPHAPKHKQEETARMYVDELAQRSLVHVTSRSMAHGWIEEIRVHDVLRDWCIENAREDGFLSIIDKTSGQVGIPSNAIMKSYRSSYQDFSGQNLEATPNLRALFGFQLSIISFPRLRFLRVLHIENSRISDLSSAIGGCIHLRFLGHVNLTDEFSPPKGVQQNELQSFRLNLNSTNFSRKCCNIDMVRFLGLMTQLTTLWLVAIVPVELMDIFSNLPRLVEIHLFRFRVLDKLPKSHHFSQSIRSFNLHATNIKQDPMPVLEKLQCLVVLKLGGYSGRTMSCSARGFPGLQNLHLIDFRFTKEWKIESGTMPKLSHMLLRRFPKMSKLPEGLLHLPSLNHLELQLVPLISLGNDSISKELGQKGCEIVLKTGDTSMLQLMSNAAIA